MQQNLRFYRTETSCLLDTPTVEVMDVEAGTAVRALGPLLCQPPLDAEVAAELGTVWAQVCVLYV